MIQPCATSVKAADAQEFMFGNTRVVFSAPLLHGTSPSLGYVVSLMIEDDQRFIYSSDVQGPLNQESVDFVTSHQPDIMILDGPPTYLVGSHYKKNDIRQAMENIKNIINTTSLNTCIIDHHLLRDLKWHDYITELQTTKKDTQVCSAAEFLGKKVDILEARRKELYGGQVCE
jgi:predicted metallo-beta-lactamase superfamily hydrolase